MGMSASQARYLDLIAQQSDLEFQGQQINESRSTLSEQTNSLYSQLQDLSVPTPPHNSDFTTVQYSGSLGADSFTLGKIIPSGSSYTVNLQYSKTGNSTYSAGKAEVKDTPQDIYLQTVETGSTTYKTAEVEGLIGAGKTVDNDTKILHKVSNSDDLSAYGDSPVIYVYQNGKYLEKNASDISDDDYKTGVYVLIDAQNADESASTTANYNSATDLKYNGVSSYTDTPSLSSYDQIASYYVIEDGKARHAVVGDFNYDKETKTYTFKSDRIFAKATTEEKGGAKYTNPDFGAGTGKSLAGNPLFETDSMNDYLTDANIESALEALRNGFPEYANYEDSDLLDLFYVSYSQEGTSNIPHFVLKTEVDSGTVSSPTQWAEFFDITATGTYTETKSYDNCHLTFDTAGRITQISIPVVDDNGEVVYHDVKLSAKSVTDEKAYEDAYNEYEYDKYLYDKEQLKINAQMSIIQEEDKKLELKLQRLDSERTQITTEIEALEKVINDNIESSYKTFSG